MVKQTVKKQRLQLILRPCYFKHSLNNNNDASCSLFFFTLKYVLFTRVIMSDKRRHHTDEYIATHLGLINSTVANRVLNINNSMKYATSIYRY